MIFPQLKKVSDHYPVEILLGGEVSEMADSIAIPSVGLKMRFNATVDQMIQKLIACDEVG